MHTKSLEQWSDWRDKLILALRLKDVPGTTIGEILAEVEAHVAETGETPEQAFGSPRDYARLRAEDVEKLPSHPKLGMTVRDTVLWILCGIGGFISGTTAWAIGQGDDNVWSVSTWLMMPIGLVLLLVPPKLIDQDIIVDPRTGRGALGISRWWNILATGFGLLGLVLIGVAGWYVSGR